MNFQRVFDLLSCKDYRDYTMADGVKANAEALVPRFKLDRVLNQGTATSSTEYIVLDCR